MLCVSRIERENWENVQVHPFCINKNKCCRSHISNNHHFLCQFLCDWIKRRRIVRFALANDVNRKHCLHDYLDILWLVLQRIHRLPFDIKSPGGYFLAALIETISAFYTNMLLISIACPFIGSSWLIISFLKDITTDLTHLKVGKLSDHKNRRKLHRHFCRILQLHSDTKQLSIELFMNFTHEKLFEVVMNSIWSCWIQIHCETQHNIRDRHCWILLVVTVDHVRSAGVSSESNSWVYFFGWHSLDFQSI